MDSSSSRTQQPPEVQRVQRVTAPVPLLSTSDATREGAARDGGRARPGVKRRGHDVIVDARPGGMGLLSPPPQPPPRVQPRTRGEELGGEVRKRGPKQTFERQSVQSGKLIEGGEVAKPRPQSWLVVVRRP